jgi:hypothetical protein
MNENKIQAIENKKVRVLWLMVVGCIIKKTKRETTAKNPSIR